MGLSRSSRAAASCVIVLEFEETTQIRASGRPRLRAHQHIGSQTSSPKTEESAGYWPGGPARIASTSSGSQVNSQSAPSWPHSPSYSLPKRDNLGRTTVPSPPCSR